MERFLTSALVAYSKKLNGSLPQREPLILPVQLSEKFISSHTSALINEKLTLVLSFLYNLPKALKHPHLAAVLYIPHIQYLIG
jgi:hypothetical protein